MKCPNCKLENRDTARFCAVCGTPFTEAPQTPSAEEPIQPAPQSEVVAEPIQPMPQAEAPAEPIPESPQFETPEERAPKKSHKRLWIALGSVAAVIAICLVTWFTNLFGLRDLTTDFYIANFTSNEVRLQYSYGKLASNTGENLLKNLATTAESGSEVRSSSGSFSLTAGDSLAKLIPGNVISFENATVGINYSMTRDANRTVFTMELTDGAEALLNATYHIDYETKTMLLSMPELTDEVLEYKLPASPATDIDPEKLAIYLERALPEEEQLNELLSGCIEAAFSAMNEVESADAAYEVAGISQTATKLTFRLNSTTFTDILLSVVTYLEENEDLRSYLTDGYNAFYDYCVEIGREKELEGYTAKTFANEIFKALADIRNQILNDRAEFERNLGNHSIDWNTYVDGSNNILAVEFTSDSTVLFAGTAEDGNKHGFEFSYLLNGTQMLLLTAENTETDGLNNGLITLNTNGASLQLKFAQDRPDAAAITLSIFENDSELFTVKATGEMTDAKEISFPVATTEDPNVFTQAIDVNTLVKKLQESKNLRAFLSLFAASAIRQQQPIVSPSYGAQNITYYIYDENGNRTPIQDPTPYF